MQKIEWPAESIVLQASALVAGARRDGYDIGYSSSSSIVMNR